MNTGFNYLQKQLELKQNLVGTGFNGAPRDGRCLINVIGEIATAENFEAENIYIQFELYKPHYWEFDYDEDDTIGFDKESLLELNRESTTTQQCINKIEISDNEHITPVAHFSFPFDYQLTVMEDYAHLRWPILLFQINSLDNWERHNIEGYGFVEIPRETGFHEIVVPTWKPRQGFTARLHSFFLGGAIKVKELKDIADSYYKLDTGEDVILNRFGVSTETAGNIKVNINIAKQSEKLLQVNKKQAETIYHKQQLQIRRENINENYNSMTPNLMQTALGKISRFQMWI